MNTSRHFAAPQFGIYALATVATYFPVSRISAYVHRDGEEFCWLVAISYGAGGVSRTNGRASTRTRAIEAARTTLHDHFSCVPQMATLQVERGRARAFPAASARPFSS
jgi:hypothetical protein